jgi:hypothetical protein
LNLKSSSKNHKKTMCSWQNVYFSRFFTYEMTTIPAGTFSVGCEHVHGLGMVWVTGSIRGVELQMPACLGDEVISCDFTIENGDLMGLQQ